MRILLKNIKAGVVKLTPENQDDLWYLSSIIEEGDEVYGTTLRKISKGDVDSKKTVTRKPVFLKIKAEKIEFAKQAETLRVLGSITEGPDDVARGEHHSFTIEPGTKISIFKNRWYKYQLDKLDDSTQTNVACIILCVMDREHAILAIIKTEGFEILTELKGNVSKKALDQKGENFYLMLSNAILEYVKKYSPVNIILASPAFFKEDFMKSLKEDDIKKKIVLATVSSVSKNGLNELLKRPELKGVLKQRRAAKEMGFVEELLQEISKDGLASYGQKQVKEAVDAGAVKILLITDKLILEKRENNKFKEIEEMMKKVESEKGEIHIINSENEGGEKLDGLGGFGAILRYKMSY